jgi:hypothetical protein
MSVSYSIDESRSAHGISRFTVIVKTPLFTQRIGPAGSLPGVPGFPTRAEAQRFVEDNRAARVFER